MKVLVSSCTDFVGVHFSRYFTPASVFKICLNKKTQTDNPRKDY